jgi:peptidyl-prolyl cis-trans isomerase C
MNARTRRFALVLCVACLTAVPVMMTGCGGGSSGGSSDFQWKPLFGDFTKDATPIVARVGDVTISERDLELYLDEMPPKVRARYNGPEGERLALSRMIEQVMLVTAAIDEEIYRETGVARNLISLRRNTLEYAMRNVGLLKGQEPTEEAMRQFYQDNKSQYRTQARNLVRHIQCESRDQAQAVYDRLRKAKDPNPWPKVVWEYSTNLVTKGADGELGWVSETGFVPNINDPGEFSKRVAPLAMGLHEPFRVGGVWHVVEVTQRVEERPQTFTEAMQKVKTDMMPGFQDAIIKDWLKAERERYDIVLEGKFAPGQGLSADELYARAMAVADAERKVELLVLLQQDYPDHERADDALFMAAYAAMGAFKDLRVADRLLETLLSEYPDSEFKADADYLRENLYNPAVRNPRSVEDLKQGD